MPRSRFHILLLCLAFFGLTQAPLSGQQRYFADTVPDGSGGCCYHFYEVYNTPMDWAAAHDYAQMLRDPVFRLPNVAHLVSIDSEKENDFVQSIISGDSWIGLTDRAGVVQNSPGGPVTVGASEGNWHWTLTHPPNTPWPPAPMAINPTVGLSPLCGGPKGQNWGNGQPGSPSPDAAYMLKSNGKWMSGPSGYAANMPIKGEPNEDDNFRLPFVVEYEVCTADLDDYFNGGGT